MSKKISIDFIRNEFLKEGYIIISDYYKSAKDKLDYICDKGHEHSITWSDWKSGYRCPYCSGNAKLNIDVVRYEFRKAGFELIDDTYINSKQKFNYKCSNGHFGKMRIDHLRRGIGCSKCSGKAKKSIEEVKMTLYNEGYTLISSEYEGVFKPLEVRCDKGHIYNTSFHNFLQGKRCPHCNGGIRTDKKEIERLLSEEGYKLLTEEYKNSAQILELECPNGHIYKVNWNNWLNKGSRCVECSGVGSSAPEIIIKDFLNNLDIEFNSNVKNLIAPYELDVVIPSKKIAIEYCGLYWHSESSGKDKKYHLNKLNRCIDIGFKLITIFEDEFLNNKKIVFSRLSYLLGIYDNFDRIFARKCVVREIPVNMARTFCEQNHLQGYTGSSVKLGAFYKDELVSVMTFAKPSIAKGYKNRENDVYELSRFCSKINYSVVGIASKFIKYFKNNFDCSVIFTFADRRWSVGNLYEKVGFSVVSSTAPNYWYFKNKKRVHRFALRKKSEDPKDKTEVQLRKEAGWERIWDCGNIKYVMEIV